MTNYLCIGVDPGYKSSATGIGLASGGVLLDSFSRHLAGEYPGQRIRSFRDLIESLIRDVRKGIYGPNRIGLLVWEEPYCKVIRKGKIAIPIVTPYRCLSYLEGRLYESCEELGVPYFPASNKQIKKALCEMGGAAKKSGMLAAAERLASKSFTDQDEADAVVIAYYAERVFEGMREANE